MLQQLDAGAVTIKSERKEFNTKQKADKLTDDLFPPFPIVPIHPIHSLFSSTTHHFGRHPESGLSVPPPVG